MEGIITASSQIAPSGKEGRTFSIQTIQFGRRGDFCQTFKSFSFELNSDDCRKEGRRFKPLRTFLKVLKLISDDYRDDVRGKRVYFFRKLLKN